MEQIYTIPINEAFEESAKGEGTVCPFCRIFAKFEADEVETILGAAMMEPAIRIRTNELGFCKEHFGKMMIAGKKLPIALLLESHLEEVGNKLRIGKLLPGKGAKNSASSLRGVAQSCYVCSRLDEKFTSVLDNAVYMWQSDPSFRSLVSKQRGFCIPHYSAFISAAASRMKSRDLGSFASSLKNVEEKYIGEIKGNVSFFIKKFDYRYENEPWGDAKDAVEKSIAALCGQDNG